MSRFLHQLCAGIWVTMILLCHSPGYSQSSSQQHITQELYEIFDSEWEYALKEYPENATFNGDKRFSDRLTDMSLAAIQQRQLHAREVLERLESINRQLLSRKDQLNYDLFKLHYEQSVKSQRFPSYLMAVSQLKGPQLDLPNLVRYTPFENIEDYQAYMKRLQAIPRYISQIISLLEEGIRQKWVMPREPLRGVAEQIRNQFELKVEESIFFEPFAKLPENIDKSAQEQLVEKGKQIISSMVLPAFRKFYTFWTEVYYPATYTEPGVWQLPNGEEYYQVQINGFTTTNLTAQQIHEIGLQEVKRIHQEMERLIDSLHFEGSYADFLNFLRTDPQFYYTRAEDLLIGYRDICKRIDPELVKLFGKLPRTPYGVKEIPAYQAPTTYTAYYQPPAEDGSRAGYFYANTYKLNTRPKYEMEALAIHEAVPGHHLQIALARELENVPKFRRSWGYTAFVEGWALYAESLGEDLGLYQDPYSKFGQLTYEMWRACRLVVDTGIHHYRWSRQKAIDYMLSNTAKTAHDISNEVDRYIVWPGQALAYKIGELKIKELRKKAEQELGENFDIRKFHDKVLENGPIPLNVLEKVMDDFIAEEKSN